MKWSKWQNQLRLQELDSMRPIQLATLAQSRRRSSRCKFPHLQGLELACRHHRELVLVFHHRQELVLGYKRGMELPSDQAFRLDQVWASVQWLDCHRFLQHRLRCHRLRR